MEGRWQGLIKAVFQLLTAHSSILFIPVLSNVKKNTKGKACGPPSDHNYKTKGPLRCSAVWETYSKWGHVHGWASMIIGVFCLVLLFDKFPTIINVRLNVWLASSLQTWFQLQVKPFTTHKMNCSVSSSVTGNFAHKSVTIFCSNLILILCFLYRSYISSWYG